MMLQGLRELTGVPVSVLLQDSKAITMFGMHPMLKEGWSGFYSEGYMYFDNCSSLFSPKVCGRDKSVVSL